jgi:hypothetical protein
MRNEGGEIQQNGLYSLPEFKKRTGLKEWAIRSARRAGLRVLYLHGRAFIRGADWMEYVGQKAASASPVQ